jgi:hypothetical protein
MMICLNTKLVDDNIEDLYYKLPMYFILSIIATSEKGITKRIRSLCRKTGLEQDIAIKIIHQIDARFRLANLPGHKWTLVSIGIPSSGSELTCVNCDIKTPSLFVEEIKWNQS